MQFENLILLLATLSLTSGLKLAQRQNSETDFTPIAPCRADDEVLRGADYCGGPCYEAEVTCTADKQYVVSPPIASPPSLTFAHSLETFFEFVFME